MKNSKPIIKRAMNGATCQLINPRSTKVNSNGSMGEEYGNGNPAFV